MLIVCRLDFSHFLFREKLSTLMGVSIAEDLFARRAGRLGENQPVMLAHLRAMGS